MSTTTVVTSTATSRVQSEDRMACALTFANTAPIPTDVLQVQVYPAPTTPGVNEVIVQMLAAPINPQDFLITAGAYPIKPNHSINGELIPGYDGVGIIVSTGSHVKDLRTGDLVIPRGQGFGTWRTHAAVKAEECAKVPQCTDIRFAAMLKMTLLPAYFLVEDILKIRPGDYILQNAGTSAIAQMVSQFARLKGAHTINIIRGSPDGSSDAAAVKMLRGKGADIVCTESEFEASGEKILSGKRIALALDCVWGKTAELMAMHLPANSLIVNFANLSGGGPHKAASFPHSYIFGKGATIKGWKSTSSLADRSNEELDDLTAWLVGLLEHGTLKMPEYQSVTWALEAGSGMPEGSAGELQQKLLGMIGRAHQGRFREPKILFEFRK